jgi:hypothetical protein
MVFHLCLQQMKKMVATNECTSIAGHFDGHPDMLKQYTWHHPMKQIQGLFRCPWMLPLADYLFPITLAAARVTGKITIMKNTHSSLAVLMAVVVRWYNTPCIAQWRRFMAFLEAIGRHHQARICSDDIKGTCHLCSFWYVSSSDW